MLSRDVRTHAFAWSLFFFTVTLSACTATPPPPASSEPALWGDLKPVVSVKELMDTMIDPAADYVFDAVGTDVGGQGVVNVAPRTDEDWARIRMGAVMLAEGIYLLKVPRAMAPPGDLNVSTGPNPPELSPAQITAKIERDKVLWNAKIEALRNVALEVLDIVKTKDVNALFAASDDLDQACEACHLEYWYPGEQARRELRRKAAVDQFQKR